MACVIWWRCGRYDMVGCGLCDMVGVACVIWWGCGLCDMVAVWHM